MSSLKIFHKKKILLVFVLCAAMLLGLVGRLAWLMLFRSEYYYKKAAELHERERDIKAARGRILDVNGTVLADNQPVCTVSVVHNQLENPEEVIRVLAEELELAEEKVRKRVEKVSALERIRANVPKETGDRIRKYNLAGVKVDEDFKRYYPYGSLASKVLGFTGSDNQGIIGLEVEYEEVLKGTDGKILTLTDARGVELADAGEARKEAVAGNDLVISLDRNIQEYAEQAARKVMEEKQAEKVSILLMNPQNGEIYACVNVPEFDLNAPFDPGTLDTAGLTEQELQDARNRMWRNGCINDTYEPGSVFKIITMAAGLEEGVVHPSDSFYCPGYCIVEDRRIRCHKVGGHGSEDFVHGAMNSCNPVFITVGLRLGIDIYYRYFQQFGLLKKTGIDLPGEAGTIMHQKENMGLVELATVSFGQSFQVTPVQLAATVSSLINGGRRVTPHFGIQVRKRDGTLLKVLEYPQGERILSEETSETVRGILKEVVSEGSGKNAAIEGYSIGGKTATSETIPRSAHRYISSFLGFTPAENPTVLGICVIHDPQGVYYGGTVAAPVIRDIFENILPYLGVEREAPVTDAQGEAG